MVQPAALIKHNISTVGAVEVMTMLIRHKINTVSFLQIEIAWV